MARLDPLPSNALRPMTRLWFWFQRLVFGRVLRPYPVIARSPRTVTAVNVMTVLFSTGHWTIGGELRTLVHLRVAQIIGCVF
jgi:alkylhydroperoxidase family enzyme